MMIKVHLVHLLRCIQVHFSPIKARKHKFDPNEKQEGGSRESRSCPPERYMSEIHIFTLTWSKGSSSQDHHFQLTVYQSSLTQSIFMPIYHYQRKGCISIKLKKSSRVLFHSPKLFSLLQDYQNIINH